MPKRLVICCDGTWNSPDQQQNGVPCPSNVTKVALCVAPTDAAGTEQRVFYDKGVGTGAFDRLRGGAFGFGIKKKILEAYSFLVANYDPGDELFFFGFSRGAYTARSTFGLIRNSGLLKRECADKMEAAYDLYRRRDKASHPTQVESTLFRKSYSHEPRAKFIGVWDTVGALGIPVGGLLQFVNRRWSFHDLQLSKSVDNAIQALAIDEKRKPFQPSVWEQDPKAVGQVLEQVWFAGVHSNIGGSYANTGLSDIALLWMVNRAEGCGLEFDRAQLKAMVKPDPLGMMQESLTWYFKLFSGAYIRPLGPPANVIWNESAASTAVDRQNNPPSNYRPPNLRDYLAGGGKVAKVI
jgi:uncharacterized protein (DUF2235 family)